MQTFSGSESDKQNTIAVIETMQQNLVFDRKVHFIADSALYSAENLVRLNRSFWITRVPVTVGGRRAGRPGLTGACGRRGGRTAPGTKGGSRFRSSAAHPVSYRTLRGQGASGFRRERGRGGRRDRRELHVVSTSMLIRYWHSTGTRRPLNGDSGSSRTLHSGYLRSS